MPVYQYACTECGEPLEVRQSFTDAALTECPVCGGRLRKVLSPVGVVFKGSGFYRTDSRADSRVGANGSSTASSGTASGASSSDTGSNADTSASTTSTSDTSSSATTKTPAAATS